jgi:hypothetical protein
VQSGGRAHVVAAYHTRQGSRWLRQARSRPRAIVWAGGVLTRSAAAIQRQEGAMPMPPISELLDDDDKLRLAVRHTTPFRMAKLVTSIDDGYGLADVRRLIRRVYELYIEEWGLTHAAEFMQNLGR